MSNPWDNLCEWMRSNSANLGSVLNNLSNQGTYSDIGTGGGQLLPANTTPVSMTQVFVMLLMVVWGYTVVQSRRNQARNEKPRSSRSSDNKPPPAGGVS